MRRLEGQAALQTYRSSRDMSTKAVGGDLTASRIMVPKLFTIRLVALQAVMTKLKKRGKVVGRSG